jgi:[NiFe] hydrogenase diaphorase moiety large subunit
MVVNNICQTGPVFLANAAEGKALANALAMSPVEVIRNVKTSRLRGRGGAGFPTGMKWEYTRAADSDRRVIICNADEGEPGTFKDRVILTEYPALMVEGMTIGAYAIGADTGIIYLRAEYTYLRDFLESVLESRRQKGLLGKSICGREDFDFDIRIQMGAGAYVCGEETALISSCEGMRGDPKNRPPFPAQRGYLGYPTSVNNVETLCGVARIMEHGPAWFSQLGSAQSAGPKLLSISGDCKRPGVYEVAMGIKLSEVLKLAGAQDAAAVQVGGPSGQMVGPSDYERAICYDDLATGGSIMVFGPERDILEVVHSFLDFFVEESCGYCTPCRAGNVLLKNGIEKLLAGLGEPGDLEYLEKLGDTVRMTSRCGLGQTSPNPVLSTLKQFRSEYESRVNAPKEGRQSGFDLASAVEEAAGIVGRKSIHSNS